LVLAAALVTASSLKPPVLYRLQPALCIHKLRRQLFIAASSSPPALCHCQLFVGCRRQLLASTANTYSTTPAALLSAALVAATGQLFVAASSSSPFFFCNSCIAAVFVTPSSPALDHCQSMLATSAQAIFMAFHGIAFYSIMRHGE